MSSELWVMDSFRIRNLQNRTQDAELRTPACMAMLAWLSVGVWAGCSSPERQADDVLARAVKQALYDETAVNLLQVDVAVDRRRVYLSGEVDLYAFKERAEQLARAVEGVEDVVSSVQVEP